MEGLYEMLEEWPAEDCDREFYTGSLKRNAFEKIGQGQDEDDAAFAGAEKGRETIPQADPPHWAPDSGSRGS